MLEYLRILKLYSLVKNSGVKDDYLTLLLKSKLKSLFIENIKEANDIR